ncbi:uncharacterized protein LOC131657444 [Vicia villosa]|uniref:uncharacterized protein LOC131657444 n=1 Tax=Vicia villosa TaxID=3911 RepID=UPI00273C0B50|nr:uncharacterized protein LOC131657444 [Vicia villosa]
MSKVQCRKYRKLGHFVAKCSAKEWESKEDEAKVTRKEVDDEATFLMMISKEFSGNLEVLDSSCKSRDNNCRRKDLFVQINQVVKNKVKFAVDSTLTVEGVSDVLIEKKNGGYYMIKDVLYIPCIKCNLLSIRQLLEKGYNIRLKNKILRVVDASGVLILKAPMASNRTFKVELKVLEHRCLDKAASREE